MIGTLTELPAQAGHGGQFLSTNGSAPSWAPTGGGDVYTGTANTFTIGPQTIQTGAAGTIGLAVRATAGQTANLQEWRDSAGTVQVCLDSSFRLVNPGTGGNAPLVLRSYENANGPVELTLRNGGGANGAIFKHYGLDLVDFGFQGSSGTQRNIRFENRGGAWTMGIGPEFQIGGPNNPPFIVTDGGKVAVYSASATVGSEYRFYSLPNGAGVPIQSAAVVSGWAENTYASRKGRVQFLVSDHLTVSREYLRGEADGTGPRLGFLGAAAVARQVLPAAATDAATTQALANSLRSALINLGLAQ
jgi:hypothetical protein